MAIEEIRRQERKEREEGKEGRIWFLYLGFSLSSITPTRAGKTEAWNIAWNSG